MAEVLTLMRHETVWPCICLTGNVTKRDDVPWALSPGTRISRRAIGSWDLTRA